MYKAILEVGGYKPGDTVPDAKAELWLRMYKFPHVEKVKDEKAEKPKPESEIDTPEEIEEEGKEIEEEDVEEPNDGMIDDYLDRNANVVISNVKKDKLPLEKLEKLLAHEKKEKKRIPVIRALENAMKEEA